MILNIMLLSPNKRIIHIHLLYALLNVPEQYNMLYNA